MPIYRSYRHPKRFKFTLNHGSFLLGCTALAFGAILSRLVWLQIIHGPENKLMVDQNRIRLVLRKPIRGRLIDRHGVILATSGLRYNMYVDPKIVNTEQWPILRHRLSKLLYSSPNQLDKSCEEGLNKNDDRLSIANDLSDKQIVNFFEQLKGFDGAELDIDTFRRYPYNSLGSHVIGYTSTITQEEYDKLRPKGYLLEDRIGRSGIERAYESTLRGDWGGQELEVNALGEVQKRLTNKPAIAGNDVQLTLDIELQKTAESILTKVSKGAIVAMDPQTGAIRAMASRPTFDGNTFSPAPSIKQWRDLNSTNAPLLNRALQGFAPASTFKVVTTMAALESGAYSSKSKILSSSSFCLRGQCYYDHAARGLIDFPMALAVSSNTVYYRVGMEVGAEELFKAGDRMGYGALTGIELANEESPGLLGDYSFKGRSFRKDWTSVDTIVSAIGQGMLEVTPLQMARLYAVVANGGWLVTPHVVEKPTQRFATGLSPATLRVLRKGLRQVVTKGTATVLNDKILPPVAGKTGTAEKPPFPDHTWFSGYAPDKQPNLVVVIFCENSGGFGGTIAAPMAKTLLKTWFQVKA